LKNINVKKQLKVTPKIIQNEIQKEQNEQNKMLNVSN